MAYRQDAGEETSVVDIVRESWGAIRDYSMMATVRMADRVAGPNILPWILIPWTVANALRRARDYPQFRRLRSTLPRDFWRGTGPLAHYLRMIIHWQRVLAFCVLADRLSELRWKKHIRVRGTPPDQLAEWNQRPVVIACLHTGGFALLRHWLRSRGIVAASLVKARPEIIRRFEEVYSGKKMSHEEELPRFFHVSSMRSATRFLTPGRVLIVAIEWQPGPASVNVKMGAPLRVGDGAVRLARLANAMLIPASVRMNDGLDICFGTPLAQELIDSNQKEPAMQFLAQEFWKDLEQDPCAIGWTTLEAYAPENLVRSRTRWP